MMEPTLVCIPFGVVNAYLLRCDRGDVLIDTGLPGMGGRLVRHLRAHGSAPDRLAAIILTHVHLDHIGNLAWLRRQTKAPLLVHRLEAHLLETGQVAVPAGQTLLARVAMGAAACGGRFLRLTPVKPDILIDDALSLQDFGVAGTLVHTPGHTVGSISLLLDSGDAVVGDLCQNAWGFGMGAGRIVPPLADVPAALPRSWRRMVECGARRWFPGHGGPFDVQSVKNLLG